MGFMLTLALDEYKQWRLAILEFHFVSGEFDPGFFGQATSDMRKRLRQSLQIFPPQLASSRCLY